MSAPALRTLMTQHNLTRADVARLLGLEVRRHSHGKLELLRLKIETKAP